MISARRYEARVMWTVSGLGDARSYPGKVRALAAIAADRASISCYRARRFHGLPWILADLISGLFAVVSPALFAVAVVYAAPVVPLDWPRVWVPRRLRDRAPSRYTTGPPCPARPMTPGGHRVISP